jgi:4-amino-4-deoxy-L-arabinose transferase-like glycosyltransferase
MKRSERWQFFLTWLFLGLLPLGLRPLWQPDEARYAEIPRQMLASGDWLTPTLHGALYFEKPPLQYWLSAFSMKLFGESAFAARLPLALAAFLTMYVAMRLARRLGSDRPVWASFAAISCLLLFSCGQLLTLDALFSSLCVFSLAAVVEAVGFRFQPTEGAHRSRIWTLLFFVGAACAVLTKGPAAIVLVGGAMALGFIFAWNEPKLRRAVLATLLSPYGWLAFLLVAVPWFVMVNAKNPGHAHFFFYTEHFERFTSNVHARQGSENAVLDKLYFVPVIILGLFPWLSACFVGARRAIKFLGSTTGPAAPNAPYSRWAVASLLAAFAWPLLFFSVSGSKLVPYVMPCFVPLIAVAIAFERDSDGFLPFKRAGVEMISLGAVFLVAATALLVFSGTASGFAEKLVELQQGNSGLWILFLGLLFIIVGIWGIRGAGLTARRWMFWHGAAFFLLAIAAQRIAGPSNSIDHLLAKVPPDIRGQAQWIGHGDHFQALPFLTKNRITIVDSAGELRFGKNRMAMDEQERWFVEDRMALTETALRLQKENPDMPVWALSLKKVWKRLPPESQASWEVVAESPKNILLKFRDLH